MSTAEAADDRGYSWPYEGQNYVIKRTKHIESSFTWEDGKFVYEAGLDIDVEDRRDRLGVFLHADVLIQILERAGYTVTPHPKERKRPTSDR